MKMYTLFTYSNLNELRKIQTEIEVVDFSYIETIKMPEDGSKVCVDISALVYFLEEKPNFILSAYINLLNLEETSDFIVKESLAKNTVNLLPLFFSEYKNYFSKKEISQDEKIGYKPYPRQKIYKYDNTEDLERIINYANENDIPIATFSQAVDSYQKDYERFNQSLKLAILDLTSVSYVIENNKAFIYTLEQFFSIMPNIKVIVQASQINIILNYFPLFFYTQEDIHNLFPEITSISEDKREDDSISKITDLNKSAFETFIQEFNNNLIGHKYFKDRLKYLLNNFIILNKVKEQKIFSVFLFGPSGVGKTEVARLIADGLKKDSYFAQINFENYSSQDALNSLKGSPAGYIGCESGELSSKIEKSKVGILLCDEFEKTTYPVFSFFLGLLEEGCFTDSLAREYNMDGYIIIFTSNIPNETEYKRIIPSELQTRFDLVCYFEEPTAEEKHEFLNLLFEKAKKKYSDIYNFSDITVNDKKNLYDFNYSKLSSLRDIKRVFNNRLMDFLDKNKNRNT